MPASYFYFILVLIILGNICQDLCAVELEMDSCQKKSVATASCEQNLLFNKPIRVKRKDIHETNSTIYE